jgi:transglutaminase-like putative cysteine protease
MRARRLVAVLVVAAAAAGVAIAQAPPAARPVPHEPIRELTGSQTSPMIGGSGAGNPAAIAAGDKVLPKPALDRGAGGGSDKSDPVLGRGGFGADRETSLRPDENTGADSTLHYVSVFNPDVLPFKRMSALDKADDDQTLHVANTATVELAVGGTTDPRTRDRFWGDVTIELTPGRDVPLPSVAPDMRILSYEVKPRIALRFSKDGADNFFVRSDEASASGTYHLIFAADADAGYFAPKLPAIRYRVRDVASHAPPELKVPIPASLAFDTRHAFDLVGVDSDMDLGVAFNKLVNYFRAFQPGDIPRSSGDIYRDLCDTKKGVCRHRAFAFMITANALGIPTRFVSNEAHAFVEVWFPERNWQRIDLGGAALRMEVQGAHDKVLHKPRSEDPFAKPPEYKNSYTQLEGDIKGLSSQQIADKRSGSPPSGAVGPDDATGSAGSGSGSNVASGNHISPDQSLQVEQQDPKKPTPRLEVTHADESAHRGGTLHVEGAVTANGKVVGDHVVQVWIALPGGGHRGALLLGSATSRNDGTFSADLVIPASVSLEKYDILLTSDDDAYYNASRSE